MNLLKRIRLNLTDDLLNKKWLKIRDKNNKLSGHCYIAAETCFHLVGGYKSKYKPYVLTHKLWPEGLDEEETHWFIKSESKILDPTANQFNIKIPYHKGKSCGFLTKDPSKRAKILIERITNGF